jgi:hypothetical protein
MFKSLSTDMSALEAALYQCGLRALDRSVRGSEALAYEEALVQLVLVVATLVTRDEVPQIKFQFERGEAAAHLPGGDSVTVPVCLCCARH